MHMNTFESDLTEATAIGSSIQSSAMFFTPIRKQDNKFISTFLSESLKLTNTDPCSDNPTRYFKIPSLILVKNHKLAYALFVTHVFYNPEKPPPNKMIRKYTRTMGIELRSDVAKIPDDTYACFFAHFVDGETLLILGPGICDIKQTLHH